MAKYSYEFKKMVVEAYLRGEGSYEYLAKKFNIPDKKPIRVWVGNYKSFGDEGLVRSRQNKKYSFEHKKNVVKLYLSTEISYQELALSLGINHPGVVAKWVADYRAGGLDALRAKRKGRPPKVPKSKKTKTSKLKNSKNERTEENKTTSDPGYLKRLEEENLMLRIENAYLKELRRLRLEERTLQKFKRESSTTSEENSD